VKWDLQQDEIQVKAAVPTSLLPAEDNKLAEPTPPLKSIMYLYPRQKEFLFGNKRRRMRHIMPWHRAASGSRTSVVRSESVQTALLSTRGCIR
jgi:hypothetical protein